jgi:hypothetical protein
MNGRTIASIVLELLAGGMRILILIDLAAFRGGNKDSGQTQFDLSWRTGFVGSWSVERHRHGWMLMGYGWDMVADVRSLRREGISDHYLLACFALR